MATLTATRCHPVIKTFYHRLLARGKAHKVAMTAAMRTFLTILNAMVKTRTPWNARLHRGPLPEPLSDTGLKAASESRRESLLGAAFFRNTIELVTVALTSAIGIGTIIEEYG
jgi:hypothetical protein